MHRVFPALFRNGECNRYAGRADTSAKRFRSWNVRIHGALRAEVDSRVIMAMFMVIKQAVFVDRQGKHRQRKQDARPE
jgi:hypothetical protein